MVSASSAIDAYMLIVYAGNESSVDPTTTVPVGFEEVPDNSLVALRSTRRGRSRLTQVAIQDFGSRISGRTGPPNPPPGQDHALACESQGPMDELLDQEDRDTGISHLLQALENRLDNDRCKAERHLVGDEQLRLDRERTA
jgi:hypothetical protein